MKRLTRPRVLAAALLAACVSAAAPARAIAFSDPYGAGSGDVLGNESDFDIRSLEVTELLPTSMQLDVDLNYHGGDTALKAFNVAGTSFANSAVGPGDVLIQGQSYLWAIPLAGSAGGIGGGIYYALSGTGPVVVGAPATRPDPLLAGSLYLVDRFMTAGEVLGVTAAADLRADVPVWGHITNFQPAFGGFAPAVTVVSGSELSVHLRVASGQSFYNDVVNGFSIHFASATCACDVIDATVPEPSSLLLALGALALTAARARLCLRVSGGPGEREPD